MRIGIYDPYLDDLGGGEKYMMTIASCLVAENTVSVFWDKKEDLQAIEKRFSLDLSRVSLASNIFSPHTSKLKRLRETKKYDVIILLTDGSIPWVGSKKLFIHIQQPLDEMQVHTIFDRIKLRRVNAFFCNSSYTKSFIEKKFGIKTKVIYPPVTISSKKKMLRQAQHKQNVILHVGRFRSVQGYDYKKQGFMIETFKKMIDKGLKNWQFILAVSVHEKDRDKFKKMEEAAKGYPITFLLNKSNNLLWDTYAKAKIYWHASGFGEDLEQHPELAEHFGISTVEAMGAGVVPVVINAGGQKEIVQEGKNGFLWETQKEMIEKTLELSKNAVTWEKLSKNAQKTAEEFSSEKFCQEIKKLIT